VDIRWHDSVASGATFPDGAIVGVIAGVRPKKNIEILVLERVHMFVLVQLFFYGFASGKG
jgi:hypothetical protein